MMWTDEKDDTEHHVLSNGCWVMGLIVEDLVMDGGRGGGVSNMRLASNYKANRRKFTSNS